MHAKRQILGDAKSVPSLFQPSEGRLIAAPFFALIFLGLILTQGHAEKLPLAQAALTQTPQLAQGGIVTAEKIGDHTTYALAGKINLPGVAPERVLFEIGSISKVFTGLLLAQAVVEKKLILDTTLQELWPQMKWADSRVGKITLRQLATHTSGLPRMPSNLEETADLRDPFAHYDRSKLKSFVVRLKLTGEPPFAMSYSNLGVGLLGDLLAEKYGQSWEELVQTKITRPLGMSDTVVKLSTEQQARFTPAYAGSASVVPWTFQALAGAGALRSTAADLILFGEAFLHPEKTPFPAALALVQQPQTPSGEIGICLGLGKIDGQPVWEHNGGTAGFTSSWKVFPNTGQIQIVLANNGKFEPESVFTAARNEKPGSKTVAKPIPAAELSAYVGIYPINATSRFTILLRGDQLYAQLTGQPFFALFPHEKADRFFLKVVPAEIQFERTQGNVTSLTLHQNGRTVPATKSADPVPTILFPSLQALQEYSGQYELSPSLKFTVKIQGETLYVQLTGQDFFPVFAKKNDWFEYDAVVAALEFERDVSGKVIALKLHQNGQTQRATRKL